MTHTDQLPHLIKMANQIAANQPVEFLGEEAAVAAVAEHIQKFWAPPMREKIIAYQQGGGAELTPLARRAVENI
ncbi:formate dehydrogenase subunit delta [Porticoccus sp. W117]|uniref:formate dehydrogenase subunit delta n=1 Tax=Porticoccus sp. W117 TaxID=3054777 RepID=UPI0025975962|nr:formate dehydrogenase subunit delta [Porticoccus sp. W117]MDM3871866.1 formate dehydrogenase subunit delta [Porticoccus sp. W117]